jgi:hypothetical protein
LRSRYVGAGLSLDGVDAAIRGVHHARVAYFGTNSAYPLYGADLSNRVRRPLDIPAPDACLAWILVLSGYDYVVVGNGDPFANDHPPQDALAADAHVKTLVYDSGGALYRLTTPLAGNRCPRPA